ncbi:MAG: hypothetical protein WC728_08050 [Elusimicrobiota bacterium]
MMFAFNIVLCLALAASAALAVLAAAAWARREGRPARYVLAAAVGFLAAAWAATAGTGLRGGYDNEHDFHSLSADFFRGSGRHSPVSKEHSPVLLFWLSDRLSGGSLEAILVTQRLAWSASAALVFAAMLASGAGLFAAFLAAGAYLFHFLSILNTYAFATTNGNVLYLLSAVCALAGLFDPARDPLRNLLWFLSSALLVLASRFEFVPLLAAGAAMSAVGSGWPGRLLKARGLRRAAWIAGCAVFLGAAAYWAWVLVRGGMIPKPGDERWALFSRMAESVDFHLGEHDLSPLFGIPSRLASWIFGGVLVLVLVRGRRSPTLLWRVFLAGWALYLPLFFPPISEYPLHSMRHHLYFLLPFLFLCGVLMDDLFVDPRAPLWGIASLGLAGYLGLNACHARSLDAEARTNDIEWRFLYKTRRSWPAGCRAAYPFADVRGELLRKYFPFEEPGGASGSGCILVYRSPHRDVLRGSLWGREPRAEDEERFYGPAFEEETFQHRFYTVWNDPKRAGPGDFTEVKDPIPLKIGFYRLPL